MNGFNNLSHEEKLFLVDMFNTVNFRGLHISNKVTVDNLKFFRDSVIQGCLKSFLKKSDLNDNSKLMITNILEINKPKIIDV